MSSRVDIAYHAAPARADTCIVAGAAHAGRARRHAAPRRARRDTARSSQRRSPTGSQRATPAAQKARRSDAAQAAQAARSASPRPTARRATAAADHAQRAVSLRAPHRQRRRRRENRGGDPTARARRQRVTASLLRAASRARATRCRAPTHRPHESFTEAHTPEAQRHQRPRTSAAGDPHRRGNSVPPNARKTCASPSRRAQTSPHRTLRASVRLTHPAGANLSATTCAADADAARDAPEHAPPPRRRHPATQHDAHTRSARSARLPTCSTVAACSNGAERATRRVLCEPAKGENGGIVRQERSACGGSSPMARWAVLAARAGGRPRRGAPRWGPRNSVSPN